MTTFEAAPGRNADNAAIARIQRRTVGTLMSSQVCGGVGLVSGISVTVLLADELTGSETLAGIAAASLSVGSAAASFPLARLMARSGRRPGLRAGYLVGAAGAFLALSAAVTGVFLLLPFGVALMGVAASANLATRYAAADLAPEAKRASTIGLMVWASTFGAGFGSLISLSFLDPAGVRIGLPNYAGSYLAGFVLLLAAGVIVEVRLRPDPLVIAGGVGTAIQHAMSFATFTRLIWENVGARVAVLAMMVSQATMVGTMTLTPLHMKHGGHTGAAIGVMLFGHMMGMYLFSPLVGKMTDRLGSYPMLLVAGVFCVFGALSAGLTPEGGFIGLVVGQAAIGLAWCFGVVAASGLLTDSVPVEKRASVQGMGDLCMSAFGALAGISAGAIVATRSYLDLNLAATALGTVLVGVVLQAVFFSGGRQVAPSRVG